MAESTSTSRRSATTPSHLSTEAGAPRRPTARALRLSWRGDEEATGWPELLLAVVVEPHGHGSRLAVLSTREPRYDLSTSHLDKQQRHAVLQQAGQDVARALAAEAATSGAGARAPAPRPGAGANVD